MHHHHLGQIPSAYLPLVLVSSSIVILQHRHFQHRHFQHRNLQHRHLQHRHPHIASFINICSPSNLHRQLSANAMKKPPKRLPRNKFPCTECTEVKGRCRFDLREDKCKQCRKKDLPCSPSKDFIEIHSQRGHWVRAMATSRHTPASTSPGPSRGEHEAGPSSHPTQPPVAPAVLHEPPPAHHGSFGSDGSAQDAIYWFLLQQVSALLSPPQASQDFDFAAAFLQTLTTPFEPAATFRATSASPSFMFFDAPASQTMSSLPSGSTVASWQGYSDAAEDSGQQSGPGVGDGTRRHDDVEDQFSSDPAQTHDVAQAPNQAPP